MALRLAMSKRRSFVTYSIPDQGHAIMLIIRFVEYKRKKASVQKRYNIILLKGVWPMVTYVFVLLSSSRRFRKIQI